VRTTLGSCQLRRIGYTGGDSVARKRNDERGSCRFSVHHPTPLGRTKGLSEKNVAGAQGQGRSWKKRLASFNADEQDESGFGECGAELPRGLEGRDRGGDEVDGAEQARLGREQTEATYGQEMGARRCSPGIKIKIFQKSRQKETSRSKQPPFKGTEPKDQPNEFNEVRT